jgi:hypothetical protein
MSRQNKINPAHYTQRGRLTPDDGARELARQRSIGSQHTWQPVQKDGVPRLPSKEDAERAAERRAKGNGQGAVKKTTGPAATPKAVKRKALLARNVGGSALKPSR